jgi:hypothetical protein
MGLADRFREAVSLAACQNNLDGPLQADPVPLGHENRLNPAFGPHDGADDGIPVVQIREAAPLRSHFAVTSDQLRFCAADRREIQEQPHVGSQADASRVSNALTVEQGDIGTLFQLFNGLQQLRPHPETQQTGDIGKETRAEKDDISVISIAG